MSDVPEGYKISEMGVIPEEWEVKTLGDCLLRTPEYGINAPAVPYSDNLPTYIRITDISEEGMFLPGKKSSVNNINSNNYFLERDDIVFARTGASTGKTYLYNSNDGDLVFAGFLIRVKVNPNDLIAQYLKSYTETGAYWNWVKIMSMRSGQPGINGNEYAQLRIPLPSLPEQQAIASALSDVDALITALEQLITKKRNIKQGAMQQLLTGEKRLPGFGGAWEVKKLEDVSEIIMGQSPAGNSYNQNAIGIALINGPTEFTEKYPIEIQWTSLPTKLCKEGDILLCIRGSSTGRMNISNDGYCIGRGIAAIRAKENSDGSFLEFQVQNAVKNILALTTGSTFPNIDGKSLKNIEVVRPPLPEQQAIAQILSDVDAEIEALKQKRDKYKAIKQGMMQELLTGKTRLV